MEILVDRVSVHAGDDTHSHVWTLTLPDDATLGEAVRHVWDASYLPHFVSGRGDWTVRPSRASEQRYAEVNEQRVEYLVDPNTRLTELSSTLFWG
ncbi:hypothetical protein [Kutzneria albida]|uniref:hypothetical protein n=1 Tax=Kutzneria albida TaxID=43357 RepID=UPI00046D3561|nr:hypothetical protein [Kutzneria albida]